MYIHCIYVELAEDCHFLATRPMCHVSSWQEVCAWFIDNDHSCVHTCTFNNTHDLFSTFRDNSGTSGVVGVWFVITTFSDNNWFIQNSGNALQVSGYIPPNETLPLILHRLIHTAHKCGLCIGCLPVQMWLSSHWKFGGGQSHNCSCVNYCIYYIMCVYIGVGCFKITAY